MTKAREIISGALRFGLNRLSPGEQEDADLFNACLDGLNSIVDAMNGSKTMLWRETLVAGSALTGMSGTLGGTWASVAPGSQVLGASYSDGAQDVGISQITVEQYHAIPQKSQAGDPQYFAPDGGALIYFWPAPVARVITLRTMSAASDFADLDTDYVMPAGYKSALQDMLADKMAPSLLGAVPPDVARSARAAKTRLMQGAKPAIIGQSTPGHNILSGWR